MDSNKYVLPSQVKGLSLGLSKCVLLTSAYLPSMHSRRSTFEVITQCTHAGIRCVRVPVPAKGTAVMQSENQACGFLTQLVRHVTPNLLSLFSSPGQRRGGPAVMTPPFITRTIDKRTGDKELKLCKGDLILSSSSSFEALVEKKMSLRPFRRGGPQTILLHPVAHLGCRCTCRN